MVTKLYVSSALVLAMYGRGSELGLYQTYTSAHLLDTLVTGLSLGGANLDLLILVHPMP